MESTKNTFAQTFSGSGVFVGQFYNSTISSPSSFLMTLTLDSPLRYPSAFGAIQHTSDKGEIQSINILSGEWDPDTKTIQLTEKSITVGGAICVYLGNVKFGVNGNVEIQGTFVKEGNGGDKGSFVCREEEYDEEVHLTGLWEGRSVPDKTLKAFIPTNPVEWTISVLLTKGEKEKEEKKKEFPVFGSGYFTDSGDVPDRPVLFYRLVGNWDKERNEMKLVKVYEKSDETDGYEIEYVGQLNKEEKEGKPGIWKLSGTWKNEKGGSFGTFNCTMQPDSRHRSTAAVVEKKGN